MEAPLRPPTTPYDGLGSRQTRPSSGGEDPAGSVGITGAFQVLLDASHNVTQATVLSAGGKASPSQMFEPPAPDAHDRRQAALRKDYESARLSDIASERMDVTSVKARRATANGYSDTANAPRAGGSFDVSGEQTGAIRAMETPEPFPAGLVRQHGVSQEVSHDGGRVVDRND
ncbi:MAG: hypothetical protein ACYTFA_17900, partial [Planctomycetota bacterium]